MKLVIEREGGFTVVDDADAITEIDVRNDAVVLTLQGDVNKWTVDLPVSSHAEACRVSAAIAVKCGVLVEPLAEGPEVDGEDDVGEAMAVATRPSTTVRRPSPPSPPPVVRSMPRRTTTPPRPPSRPPSRRPRASPPDGGIPPRSSRRLEFVEKCKIRMY